MKYLLTEIPPLAARGAAGMTAALVFAGLALARGRGLRVPGGAVRPLVVASFLNVFAWMGFSTLSLQWLSASHGALLAYTMPVWAALWAWAVQGSRPSPMALAGFVLCIGGMTQLIGGFSGALALERMPGVLLALGAAACFGLGAVTSARLQAVPQFSLLAWQLGLGSMPMLILAFAFGPPLPARISPLAWSLMAYMTIVPMGLCYLTWFAAMRRLNPATAAVATMLTPIIGISSASFALGESLGVRESIASAIILGGVAMVIWKRRSG